jgi:branched-chain amino acid transport system substrate-binding protein
MTVWITSLVLALAALGAAAQQPAPIIVGATAPNLAPGLGYRRALLLWQDQVNAAGGLLGRPVELRLLDDGGDAVRARDLYRKLIDEDRAEVLIGPFGSAATLLVAAETERARRVLINGGAPARAVHRRSPKFVVQTVAPYAAYAQGVLELAEAAGCRTLEITGGSEAGSSEMAEFATDRARAQGFALKPVEAGAQGWIVFSELREARETIVALRRHRASVGLFFFLAATHPRFVETVGMEAERTLGIVRYDAALKTPGNAEFVKAFRARWNVVPAVAAAEGWVAATVLAEGVRRAGTLDAPKLRAALVALETETILGSYKVDPASGVQTGMKPAVAQILKGQPQIVWPSSLKTAEASLQCH